MHISKCALVAKSVIFEALQTFLFTVSRNSGTNPHDLEEIVKANEKLTDYKAQLENKGYYDSVESPSPASVSAEQEQQIKRAISEAMFNEPTYFKKDGGIISIFDMIKPVNAQR